jgi:hypothetical protein
MRKKLSGFSLMVRRTSDARMTSYGALETFSAFSGTGLRARNGLMVATKGFLFSYG